MYSSLNFNSFIGLNGDCFDRYLIRVNEMRESIKIINQCLFILDKLPEDSSLNIDNNKIFYPTRKQIKNSMESLIHHFKLFSEGFVLHKSDIYACAEAPKGEFGIFLSNNNTNRPYRCHVKAPGFLHLQSLDFFARKHMIADIVTLIGTLDIVFGEIDR